MAVANHVISHPRINQAQADIEAALRNSVARLDPIVANIVAYHFGWADESGTLTEAGNGRRRVGVLTLLCATVGGAKWDRAIPAAVACELASNAATIQDDIIDDDDARRGRKSAWTVFGTSRTLLACMTMTGLATEALTERSDIDPERVSAATHRLSRAIIGLNLGQLYDIEFERTQQVSLTDYLQMVEGKAGAFGSCACMLGAMFTGVPDTEGLGTLGSRLGLVWQLRNDLLGIWGDPDQTGKPALSDLRTRKKTFPVIAALESNRSDRDELADLLRYRDGDLSPEDAFRAAKLIERCGGRERTEQELRRRLDIALATLEEVVPDHETRADLRFLAEFFAFSTR